MVDLNLLISLLQTQSYFGEEERMVDTIVDYLNDKHGSDTSVIFTVENLPNGHKNVLITKGQVETYPLIIAHIDTVHDIMENNDINIHYDGGGIVYGLNNQGQPTGCGGDDKCGIYIALKMLERVDNIKVGLFGGEEFGCHGSTNADASFFSDVGYAIQFDAPMNNLISESCNGLLLFDRNGDFFEQIEPIIDEYMIDKKFCQHPYTDVWAMKSRFNISCINFSAGYYKYHTKNEYVNLNDLANFTEMGYKIITHLGENRFHFDRVQLYGI